ncbi:dephospho-CoA kinase [uncultured Veillonella sp.]|uniref:dephospho-CoA kinase n=1 Tax=uncultured Veillonella sp. TaxID=159268 RepID=UPI0025D1C2AD|nr:dephospho-CoA kinase [uncultured Veillonella sp.]MDY3973355.1 dephospho-CoA kinase [Veillonella caviae]
MYRIGLTGGIAAGKSTVSQWLQSQGHAVIDADKVAREVVEVGTVGYKAVVEAFGPDVVNADQSLNRAALGSIIFNDENKRKLLNALLHDLIKERINYLAANFEAEGYSIIIYDIPLLIETGWHTLMDEVWLVESTKEHQLHRLMVRNGLTEEEALARMNSQMPTEEKRRYSQIIIHNNDDIPSLELQLQHIWQELEIRLKKEMA